MDKIYITGTATFLVNAAKGKSILLWANEETYSQRFVGRDKLIEFVEVQGINEETDVQDFTITQVEGECIGKHFFVTLTVEAVCIVDDSEDYKGIDAQFSNSDEQKKYFAAQHYHSSFAVTDAK